MNMSMNTLNRRAITVLEMTVSLVILAAVVLIGAQLLATAQHLRRAAAQRTTAVEEAANMMERLAAAPFEELSQSAKQQQLSPQAQRLLSGAQLTIEVVDDEQNSPAKKILIEISWRDRSGNYALPVRLAAWRYPH